MRDDDQDGCPLSRLSLHMSNGKSRVREQEGVEIGSRKPLFALMLIAPPFGTAPSAIWPDRAMCDRTHETAPTSSPGPVSLGLCTLPEPEQAVAMHAHRPAGLEEFNGEEERRES